MTPERYINNLKENELNQERTLYSHSDSDSVRVDKTLDNNQINSCQKNNDRLKKSVSLSAQYKPTHNKSETGHKQKSCPIHKKKKMKDPEAFTPFVSDHLIKTY